MYYLQPLRSAPVGSQTREFSRYNGIDSKVCKLRLAREFDTGFDRNTEIIPVCFCLPILCNKEKEGKIS